MQGNYKYMNKNLRIAVAAGTSEATDLINKIGKIYSVTAFTATEYGVEILKNSPCKTHYGRLNEAEFAEIFKKSDFDAVIDATHPFAEEVSNILKRVCKNLEIFYLRLLRENTEYNYKKIIYADSKEKAAEILSHHNGNILLTTGAKTLDFYEKNVKDFALRGWVRILDTADSRYLTKNSKSHIIYSVPPFSTEDTLKILKENNISIILSKDSGIRGGVPEKLAAAEIFQIPVVMIRRPVEKDGFTENEIIEKLKVI